MTKKTRGLRRRTRDKFKKSPREKTTVNQFLEEFKKGEKVVVKIESSSHRGMPFSRFSGKNGLVLGKRGNAYVVELKDGNLKKKIITYPEHLRHIKI